MAGRTISTKVTIEGEKQYRSAITSINTVLKELKSEMQLVTAQFQGNANSQEALAAKSEILKRQLSEQQTLMKTLTSAIQSGKKAQDEWRSAIDTTKSSLATVNEKLSGLDASTQKNGQEWLTLKNRLEAAKAELNALKSSTGDTTKEEERLTAQIEDLQGQMKALDESTGGSASETGRLYEEQAKLTTTMETQEGRLQTVTDKTNKWQTQLNKATAEVVSLSAQEQKNNQYMEEAQAAADKCATSIDKYGNEVKEAGQNSQSAANGIQQTNDALDAMQSILITAGIETAVKKVVSALRDCVDVSANFRYTMATVQATSGATTDELDKLTAQAQEYASTTIFLAQDVAESYQAMAQAGWSVDDMLDSMSGVMNLAAASAEDLGSVTNIVVDAMTAFGYSTSEAGRFADVLAEAAADSNTSVALMGDSFTAVSSTAGAMGYTIEDVAVALAALANNGIKSEMAGTALATAITRMSGSNETATKAMKELGLSMTDTETGAARPLGECLEELRAAFAGMNDEQKINYAYQLAGQRGMKGLLAIVNTSSETWDNLTESINNCNGAAEEMANIQLDTYTGQVQLLDSAMEGLKMEVGDQLTPALGSLVEIFTDVINGMTAFISENEGAIPILTGAATAVGTFATAITVATTAVKVFQIAQSTLGAAFGPLGIAVGVASAALGLLATSFIETESAATDADKCISSAKDSAQEWATTQETLSTSETNVMGLMTSLISLSSQTVKSDADIAMIKKTTDELNSSVEGLNLSYDEQTDSLSMTTEALEAYVETMMLQQKAEAVVERMVELKSEEYDIEQELADAKANTAAIQAEYNAEVEQYGEANGKLTGDLKTAQETEVALGEALESNRKQYTELEGKYGEITDQINTYSDSLEETKDGTDGLAESTDGASEAVSGLSEELSENNSALQDIISGAESAVESGNSLRETYEELYSQFEDLDGEMDETTRLMAEQALEALNLAATNQELTSSCEYYVQSLEKAGYSVSDLSQYLIDSGITAEEWKEQVSSAIDTIVNGFDTLSLDSETTIYQMGENLQSNIATYTTWQQNISALMAAAKQSGNETSVAFIQYMADMGVESAAQVAQMASDMEYTFGTLAPTWSAAVDAATSACTSGLVKGGANAESAVNDTVDAGIDAITRADTNTAGKGYMQRMSDGAKAQKQTVRGSVEQVAQAGIDAIEKADSGTAGSDYAQRMAQGVTSGASSMWSAGTTLASNAYKGASSYNYYSVGYNVASGMASGIYGGSSLVTNAAKSVAQKAYQAAKSSLAIKSPSRVMAEIGKYYDEGFAQGIEDNANMVLESVKDMTKASVFEAESGAKDTGNTVITNNYGGESSETYSMLAKYLPRLLNALENDGGITIKGLAKAITPYVDGELGTAEKRRSRGN